MIQNSFSIPHLIEVLRTVLPARKEPYPLHEPAFCGNEWHYLKECLDSGWVSSIGSFVDRFEADLAQLTGTSRAIVTVNGTAALHICLKLCEVERDDEVLVPALTFVATANAVTYCGAIPHFVDSSEETLGVCPNRLEDYLNKIATVRSDQCFNNSSGRRIKAFVVVHTFGHPSDLDSLKTICDRFCIDLIEDASESLGSFYRGRHTGNHGKVSALSFNGNKIVTTGGGGAILTNDPALGFKAKHLTTTAKLPHKWAFHHDQIGYNYRMPNLNAALGCAQLEKLPDFLRAKRTLAQRYKAAFQEFGGMRFFSEPAHCSSNYWLNLIILEEEHSALRDDILAATHEAGILTRPAWNLMPHLPMYKEFPAMDLEVAKSLERRIVNLPSSSCLAGNATLQAKIET